MKDNFKGIILIIVAIAAGISGYMLLNTDLDGYSIICFTVAFIALVFGGKFLFESSNPTTINYSEYDNAQIAPQDTNNIIGGNNTSLNISDSNSNTNNSINNNTARTYNTNTNKTDLPQTGIEDYNIGFLLIICVASAIFAYKKVQEYRNI